MRSPIAKFLSEDELAAFAGAPASTVLFGADDPTLVARVLGALRMHLGESLGLIDESRFEFLWVTDFPMFDWSEEDDRWGAVHHPFTRPTPEWEERFDQEPGEATAHAYDLIVNGNEIGGGSFRIHEPELQARVFGLLGITPDEQRVKFGFLLDALRHGRAAARRDRVRDRPDGDGARGRAEPARRDRVSRRTRRASIR